MRRAAASRIYVSEKEFYSNHVVELLNCVAVNIFPLTGELPATEWLGGAIVITSACIEPSSFKDIRAISDFYKTSTDSTFAYHISSFDLASGSLTPQSLISRL